jgi:Tol biopolymer transport system component
MFRKSAALLLSLATVLCMQAEVKPLPLAPDAGAAALLPAPEIFAPGVISGPGGDGSPAFSPDGNTIYFTRSAAHWTIILESHKVDGQWSKPVIAPFSGEWPESSPAMAPDGSYIVYQTIRRAPAGSVSELWRADRTESGWGKPFRLPDSVNIGKSIWKPSVAADGTIYFTHIDKDGNKRLYSARYRNGAYEAAQPLSFSDGTTADVDPEIAPDGSFLVFCSSGRLAGDTKDHLFLVRRQGEGWGKVTQIRYAGDEQKPEGFSTDDEPHLGPDHRTLYFTSDRSMPVHFPRTREQAQQDFERMESWDNGNTNVWFISISSLL